MHRLRAPNHRYLLSRGILFVLIFIVRNPGRKGEGGGESGGEEGVKER